MNLKYFLRGLGTGIVFSVLVLGISSRISGSDTLTDSEIIERAKQLGMVEQEEAMNDSLNQVIENQENGEQGNGQNGEPDDSQEGSIGEGENLENNDAENGSGDSEQGVSDGEGSDQKETEQENSNGEDLEQEDTDQEGEPESAETEPVKEEEKQVVYNITIVPGMSSRQVTEALEDIGVIDDAKDFETYLIDNGYSTKIRAGTYKIKGKLSYEELAKKIAE